MKTAPTEHQEHPENEAIRNAIREGFESGEKEGWVSEEDFLKACHNVLKKHERKLKKAA